MNQLDAWEGGKDDPAVRDGMDEPLSWLGWSLCLMSALFVLGIVLLFATEILR